MVYQNICTTLFELILKFIGYTLPYFLLIDYLLFSNIETLRVFLISNELGKEANMAYFVLKKLCLVSEHIEKRQ